MRARFRLVSMCIVLCLGGQWLPATVEFVRHGAAQPLVVAQTAGKAADTKPENAASTVPAPTATSPAPAAPVGSAPAQQSVHVLKTVTLSVDPATNAASGIIQLTNPTNAAVKLSIFASDFVSCTTGKGLNSKIVFSIPPQAAAVVAVASAPAPAALAAPASASAPAAGSTPSPAPAPRSALSAVPSPAPTPVSAVAAANRAALAGQEVLLAEIPAGETLAVKVEATGLWEAGESVAEIFRHKTSLGKIKASKYRPAFAVKLDSPTPDKPVIEFTYNKPQELCLKNDDPMTYVVDARVTIDSRSKEVTGLVIPANGTATFMVKPDKEWFDFESNLRRQVRDGKLTLRFAPPGGASPIGMPNKQIEFKANLVGNGWQPAPSFIFVIIFAALGGACSLVLNNWVPNKIKRADAFDRLDNLSGPIRDISNRVDSGLRVLLRVERHRLKAMLRSQNVVFPEFGEVAKTCNAKIDVLTRQIQLAKQLSDAHRSLDAVTTLELIPSKVESIAKSLQGAADLLRRAEPTAAELQAATDSIAAANASIAAMNQADKDFEGSLTKRVAALKAFWDSIPDLGPVPNPFPSEFPKFPPFLKAIHKKIPGAFAAYDSQLLVDVGPEDYVSIDVKITRVELIRAYAEHCDPTFQLTDHPNLEEFAAFLNKRTTEGVQHALEYLAEVKQGIFEQDLARAIVETPPEIVVDPPPLEDQLVKFSIQFNEAQPQYNSAVAKSAVFCKFDFGHRDVELTEPGWEVFHFFPIPKSDAAHASATAGGAGHAAPKTGPNQYTVKVKYFLNGKPIVDPHGNPIVSSKEVTVQPLPKPFGDRNTAEAVRLAIALGVALVGLIAGGQEQLAKLDIFPAAIAVFMLGFSADTIKNLFSQKPPA